MKTQLPWTVYTPNRSVAARCSVLSVAAAAVNCFPAGSTVSFAGRNVYTLPEDEHDIRRIATALRERVSIDCEVQGRWVKTAGGVA